MRILLGSPQLPYGFGKEENSNGRDHDLEVKKKIVKTLRGGGF